MREFAYTMVSLVEFIKRSIKIPEIVGILMFIIGLLGKEKFWRSSLLL